MSSVLQNLKKISRDESSPEIKSQTLTPEGIDTAIRSFSYARQSTVSTDDDPATPSCTLNSFANFHSLPYRKKIEKEVGLSDTHILDILTFRIQVLIIPSAHKVITPTLPPIQHAEVIDELWVSLAVSAAASLFSQIRNVWSPPT